MAVLKRPFPELVTGGVLNPCKCLWQYSLILVLGLTVGIRCQGQEFSREYHLKAVLLYNLTQFVDWPVEAFASPEAPFVVCVLGTDPFGKLLDEAVRGERSNRRPIVVRRISRVEEAQDAQVLFFGETRRKEVGDALEHVRGRPVLTVGDFDGFLSAGGMVRMASTPDRKIKLRVNLDRAKGSSLVLSAKLLRVCTIVEGREE
jgi:YfiR/HmsC-like